MTYKTTLRRGLTAGTYDSESIAENRAQRDPDRLPRRETEDELDARFAAFLQTERGQELVTLLGRRWLIPGCTDLASDEVIEAQRQKLLAARQQEAAA